MSAVHLSSSARIDRVHRVWLDLLVGPVSLALVLLFSLLIPVRAQAQTNMTLNQLIPDLIRNTSQTVTASSAGLQVAEAGSVGIRSGATLIGRVAINELRSIPLATIAGRAVTSSFPGIVALLAVDLISYGIKQCTTSGTGWCGPQQNPNAGDIGFDGYQWRVSTGNGVSFGDSPGSACQAAITAYGNSSWVYSSVAQVSATQYNCILTNGLVFSSAWSNQPTCASGYVVSGSSCVLDPKAPQVAYTYPQLSPALAQVLSGNPNRAKDYWGFEPWTEQSNWIADPSTQALPAQIVSPANGTVTGPTSSTQTPSGTSTTQSNCVVSPNSNASTLANSPVSVACTLTTTNPDGTTSTSTTTTTPTTTDGTNPQPPAQPASAPVPCGLGTNGSPKCQIDETGTPTTSAATTAMTQPATDLQTAEQTAETQLKNVNNGISWPLHMPHILPGGTCQPIEWFSWGTWRGSWDVCTQLQYVRDLLAWLWPVLSAVYVWNKAAGANTVNV